MTNDSGISREEQRLIHRLMTYWRALSGGGPIPRFEDFDPRAVPTMWDDSFLVDARDPSTLVFHAIGAHHAIAIGRDPFGQPVTTVGEDTLLGRRVIRGEGDRAPGADHQWAVSSSTQTATYASTEAS